MSQCNEIYYTTSANVRLYPFYLHRVKLRIKTDCQQFDMKEDVIEENHKQADNIDLEPVSSPSNEITSPHLAPEQANQTKVLLIVLSR